MRREEKKGEAKQTNQDPVNVRIADRFREPPLGDGLLVFVVLNASSRFVVRIAVDTARVSTYLRAKRNG